MLPFVWVQEKEKKNSKGKKKNRDKKISTRTLGEIIWIKECACRHIKKKKKNHFSHGKRHL